MTGPVDPSARAGVDISRRALLATGSSALAAGLSGCVYVGPFRWTDISASIREPFETEPPVSVPVTVDVAIQNLDSRGVAMRGVDLVVLDEEREPLATQALGEFTWRGAPPEQRESEEHDTGLVGTTTSYTATWTLERSVEVEEVPEWISFEVEEIWFGDDDEDAAVVGKARATTPPPEFTATVQRLESARPLAPTVGSEDYRAMDVHRGVGVGSAVLPAPTPTPTATRNGTATRDATATQNESATQVPTATQNGTATQGPTATKNETDTDS